MRSSIFSQHANRGAAAGGGRSSQGSDATTNALSHEQELAAERENDAILRALGNDMERVQNEARGLRQEVQEHNALLDALGRSMGVAVNGVRSSASRLADVMQRNGWRQNLTLAIGIFVLLVVIYYIIRRASTATSINASIPPA
mgnify:FL=1